ncbi:hypothetical protein A3A38_04645 [Candidatus Kaiserbacteria bacterium RIFCSPLOWO2_01_FULL_53_17]|uniref:Uncharacterized protein n=1 Tax=Candidatus Kaiserbacteria bacterium RIFCSPLOWO2_01_FULL_53_17 TaxID=1798511 RepID=A0A1F6EG18_9BACT|nr:MAG: hypothetical protein A3A38_04645 [Candidatus Kaiserbacteria bacterium RIFCSPLOWO2_01_FULL_53_17]
MGKVIYKNLFRIYKSHLQNAEYQDARNTLLKIKEINPAKGWYHQGLLYPRLATKRASRRDVFSKQVGYFKKSLSYNGKDPSAWRALGNAYFQLKKYDLAERAYRQSLKFSRSELYKNDALRFIADILIVRGELKKALAILNKVFRSKHRPPYIQLASHFVSYYQKVGNQEMVNHWAKKAILSAKIIEKSGKPAYGPKDIYQKVIRDFEGFIKG